MQVPNKSLSSFTLSIHFTFPSAFDPFNEPWQAFSFFIWSWTCFVNYQASLNRVAPFLILASMDLKESNSALNCTAKPLIHQGRQNSSQERKMPQNCFQRNLQHPSRLTWLYICIKYSDPSQINAMWQRIHPVTNHSTALYPIQKSQDNCWWTECIAITSPFPHSGTIVWIH